MTRHQKYNISEGSATYHSKDDCTTATLEIHSSTVSSMASSKVPITDMPIGVASPRLVDDGKIHWTWIPVVIAGICALAFLVCIWSIPGSPAHLVGVGPWAGEEEIDRQGRLTVYPRIRNFYNESSFPDHYFISMDKVDFRSNFEAINQLTLSYPRHLPDAPPPHPYVHCWLELPSADSPCFYDRGWFGRACNANNRYGYDVNTDEVNPCFVVRIENSGPWNPINIERNDLKEKYRDHFDASFISFSCRAQRYGDRETITFDRYPIKGFPTAFFPMDHFPQSTYLFPAVMVKVKGLKRGYNTTIECWIRSPNSYHLKDSGSMIISFVWDHQMGFAAHPEHSIRGPPSKGPVSRHSTTEKARTRPRSVANETEATSTQMYTEEYPDVNA